MVTKEYIKGFFDGEGCVAVRPKKLIVVNTNLPIIQDIQKELIKYEISSVLKTRKPNKPNHRVAYYLIIMGYYNIKKFVDIIGTNHRDKQKQMVELIKSYQVIQTSKKDKKDIIKFRKRGYTMRDIAKIVDYTPATVYNILKKCSLKGIGGQVIA